jgi:hypothetical protein
MDQVRGTFFIDDGVVIFDDFVLKTSMGFIAIQMPAVKSATRNSKLRMASQ